MGDTCAKYDGEILINTRIQTGKAKQQLISLKEQMNKTAQKIESLKNKMESLEKAKIPTDEYKEVQSQIESTKTKLNALNERMEKWIALGKDTKSNAFKSMQYDAAQLENSLEYLKGEMAELKASGQAYVNPIETDAYKKMSTDLQNASLHMDGLKSKATVAALEFQKAVAKEQQMSMKASETSAKLGQVVTKEQQMSAKAGETSAKFGQVSQAAGRISTRLKAAVKGVKNLHTGAKKANGGFSNLLQTMKQMMLSMAVFQIMFKGLEYVKSGLQNLAVYSKEYNKTMSEFSSATSQLKNGLAVAFQPILNVVIPILTNLINHLNSAANAVSRFFAILGGKSTYTKAIKQNKDYAASLDKAGSSADKASGALASFDDLNVLQKNDASGGGSSGGADGSGFTEESVGSVSDWSQSIKDAIDNEDWYQVGALIAQKLNESLESIDWEPIQEKANEIGTNIAKFINGAVDELDWNLVGSTLGEGINTAFAFLDGFVKEFDFGAFGTGIGTGISGAISSIKWEQHGQTLGTLATGLFNTLDSLIAATDFKSLGEGITSAISGFFSTFQWSSVSSTLSHVISGLFDFLTGLIAGIDWTSLPQNIIDGIVDFFTGFDYATVFSSFGEHIATTLAAGIDLDKGLREVCGDAAVIIGTFFAEKMKEAGYDEDKGLAENGKAIITGVNNGILEALGNIGGWIEENILLPFIDGFMRAFGISDSASTVMEEHGISVMEGFLLGIESLVGTVKEKWQKIKDDINQKMTEIGQRIRTKLGEVKEDWTEKWTSIKASTKAHLATIHQVASEKITATKQKISDTAKSIRDTWSQRWNSIRTKTTSTCSSIRSGVSTSMSTIRAGISNSLGNIKKKWSETWTSMKTSVVSIFKGIWSSIKGVINSIISGVEKMANGVIKGINGMIDSLNNLSFTAPDWVPDIGGQTIGFNIGKIATISIPRLANGGITTGSTLANIGEAGREAVLPLENNLGYLDAFAEKIASKMPSYNGPATIVMTIDGKEFARAELPYFNSESRRIGVKLVAE